MKKLKKKKKLTPYRKGLQALWDLQAKLGKPPKAAKVARYVDELVLEAGLKGDLLEHYFRLYAACALRNKECLCRNWGSK